MEENILEFEISGCIYTGNTNVTLENFNDAFIEFCESKGWEYCGILNPFEDEKSSK